MTTSTLTPDSVPLFEPAPAWLRAIGAIGGAAAILAGGAAMVFAGMNAPAPLWTVVGMQALVVGGGGFAVAWSRGAFAAGPVLGLLCGAGSIGVGGFLSFVANREALGPLPMKAWSGVELLIAVLLVAAAFWSAVCRDPSSKKPAIKGVLLALPAIVGVLLVVAGSRVGLEKALAGLPMLARLGIMLGYGAVASVMACMSAHALSTAFDRAATHGRQAPQA